MDTREFDLDLFDEHIFLMAGQPDGVRMHMHREPIRKLMAERDTLKALCVDLTARLERYCGENAWPEDRDVLTRARSILK